MNNLIYLLKELEISAVETKPFAHGFGAESQTYTSYQEELDLELPKME